MFSFYNRGGDVMLLEEFDFDKDAIINPDMVVDKLEDFPEVTISCFSKNF